jgi:hypothetical protein
MNADILTFILSLAGILIMGLLTLIFFFFKRLVKQNDNMILDINQIRLILTQSSSVMDNMQSGCHERHININLQINHLTDQVNQHDKDILLLKQKS